MTRMIRINRCSQCPFSYKDGTFYTCQELYGKVIPNPTIIPEWCPLVKIEEDK